MSTVFHYKKYLKYKQKYIKHKLSGGAGGVNGANDVKSTNNAESSTNNAESSTNNAESSTNNAKSSTNNAESSTLFDLIKSNTLISPQTFFHKDIKVKDTIIPVKGYEDYYDLLNKIYNTLYYNLPEYKQNKNMWSVYPFITNNKYSSFYNCLKEFEKIDDEDKSIIKSIINHFEFIDLSSCLYWKGDTKVETCLYPPKFRTYMWHVSEEFMIKKELGILTYGLYNLFADKPQLGILDSPDKNFFKITDKYYEMLPTDIQTFYVKCNMGKCWKYIYDESNAVGQCHIEEFPLTFNYTKYKNYYYDAFNGYSSESKDVTYIKDPNSKKHTGRPDMILLKDHPSFK
jgi:hypothetical protein